jgi:hypothetical protein
MRRKINIRVFYMCVLLARVYMEFSAAIRQLAARPAHYRPNLIYGAANKWASDLNYTGGCDLRRARSLFCSAGDSQRKTCARINWCARKIIKQKDAGAEGTGFWRNYSAFIGRPVVGTFRRAIWRTFYIFVHTGFSALNG